MQFETEIKIESFRYGCADTYKFTFTDNMVSVAQGVRKSVGHSDQGSDLKWEGQSLSSILRESSYLTSPDDLQSLIEFLWRDWRGESISNQDLEAGLNDLANWLKAINDAKPSTGILADYIS